VCWLRWWGTWLCSWQWLSGSTMMVKQSSSPYNISWSHRGGIVLYLYPFFYFGSRQGVNCQHHTQGALPLGRGPSTYFTGVWVDLGASLGRYGKCCLHQGLKPRLFSPLQVMISFGVDMNKLHGIIVFLIRWLSLYYVIGGIAYKTLNIVEYCRSWC
jgi:hypothetical protein